MKRKKSLQNSYKNTILEKRKHFRFIHVAVIIAFMIVLIIISFYDIFLMDSKPPSGGNGSREQKEKENARARSHTRLIVGTRRDSNNDKLGYLPRTASTTLRITSCSCSNFTSLLAPSGSPIRCISYRWLV